jgi:hypothetical protein
MTIRARDRRSSIPIVALLLLALATALAATHTPLARAGQPRCASAPAGHRAAAAGACAKTGRHAKPKPKAKVHKQSKGRSHHTKKRVSKKTHKTAPTGRLTPALCEDGSKPSPGAAGPYSCEDGSEPGCEGGSELAKSTHPGAPACVASPAESAESGAPAICEDGSEPEQGQDGTFACQDGSEPSCADGSEPSLTRTESSLICAAGSDEEQSS